MSNVHVPDDILLNILARLHSKPLFRFKSVSKHWNCLIKDPYFLNSRSRRMILLPFLPTLHAIDKDIHANDMSRSLIKLCSGSENINISYVTIVGTFNGIVLLVLRGTIQRSDVILFNPFTQVSKKVPKPSQCDYYSTRAVGFASTPDDYKIVMFFYDYPELYYYCYVFSLKESLWSKPKSFIRNFNFLDDAGMFLNGFLYWLAEKNEVVKVIMALDVKEMVMSEIPLPDQYEVDKHILCEPDGREWRYNSAPLGELHGCLCTIQRSDIGFDLWVMKEQGDGKSWTIACSFTFGSIFDYFIPISILDNGTILLTGNYLNQVTIYNTTNDSCKTLELPKNLDWRVNGGGIEYIESLVSPSDMCSHNFPLM